MLMAHKKEVRQCKLNEGMNPDWTVGPVWVTRRAAIESASTIPNGCTSRELMAKDDFHVVSHEEKRS